MFKLRCISKHIKSGAAGVGAKDCTPEISTSEVIAGFQRRFPMKCRWHFPTEFHCSAIFPQKDCHFSSGLLLELSNGFSVAISNGNSLL